MSSYSFYIFDLFPEEKTLTTDPQIELQHTEIKTEFEFSQITSKGHFERYNVKHFTRVKFKGIPYYHKEAIDEVTELHRFNAYVSREKNLLLVKYGKAVSDEVASRLNNKYSKAKIKRLKLNLKKLLPKFRTLIGSYFKNIQVPHLKSTALFGPGVDESEFYRMIDVLGDLSAVIVIVNYNNEDHNVLISKDYTIRFYKDFPEDFEIDFLLSLKNVLDEAIEEEEVSTTERVRGTVDESQEGDLFQDLR